MEKIQIRKGDTHTLTWVFTDPDTSEQINVSTYEFTFTVKKRFTQADSIASIQKTDGSFTKSNGTITLVLSASDTKLAAGSYVADLQYNNSGVIVTPTTFNITILEEVTISE